MSVVRTLKGLNGGRVLEDLERAMSEVLAGVVSTNGKGEVTLKLRVEFQEEEGGNIAVAIRGEVKQQVPRAGRPKQTHYVTGIDSTGGLLGLSSRDPRQPTLPGMDAGVAGDEKQGDRTVSVVDGKRLAAGE